MTRVGIIAGALLLGCAGCEGVGGPAAAPSNGPPQTDVTPYSAGATSAHFILRANGGQSVDMLVGPRSITGPTFTLTRYTDASDHAIRGNAFNPPGDLT